MVPNINGIPHLGACLASLHKQTAAVDIIVVDNNSFDGSLKLIAKDFPKVTVIRQSKNYGFTGGTNPGMKWAIDHNAHYVALLNNDAVAKPDWAEQLITHMDKHPRVGIATSKITNISGKLLDSTGEFYTSWGLPFARGRGEVDKGQYDTKTDICAASGGASIYRVSMLKKIGLFDQDFFAYYEDVDLSLRAQLNGWHVAFVPGAIVHHHIGATSKKIPGFATYQTVKNLPWVAIKNVPKGLLHIVLPRLWLSHSAYFWKAVFVGNGWAAIRGFCVCYALLPKKLVERRKIQSSATTPENIKKHMLFDLPPDATNLHRLRKVFGRG